MILKMEKYIKVNLTDSMHYSENLQAKAFPPFHMDSIMEFEVVFEAKQLNSSMGTADVQDQSLKNSYKEVHSDSFVNIDPGTDNTTLQ